MSYIPPELREKFPCDRLPEGPFCEFKQRQGTCEGLAVHQPDQRTRCVSTLSRAYRVALRDFNKEHGTQIRAPEEEPPRIIHPTPSFS